MQDNNEKTPKKLQAKQSFSKDMYDCKQNWPSDTFCQCGGDGIVLTGNDSSIEKALTDTNEALELIGTVAGAKTSKKHYRTAFFEAFPKNPQCFLRGEGPTVADAELNAWEKYTKILNCKEHDFERKGRTDGYCYCKKCPLSGSFLDPLTTCKECSIPTTDATDSEGQHYCYHHYFTKLNPDQIVHAEMTKWMGLSDYTPENQKLWFLEEQFLYNEFMNKYGLDKMTKEFWKQITHAFNWYRNHIETQYNPFFGKKTKTEKEIHDLIIEAFPVLVLRVDEYLVKNKFI